MARVRSVLLCLLTAFPCACHHDSAEQPEPAGALEGTWRVGLTDPVLYDAQNNVLVAYQPQTDFLDYTQLTFTATDLEQYNNRTNLRLATPYTRTGDQLTCPPQARSYTIRKLTTRHLDLYNRGEYVQVGSSTTRMDFVVHLERQ